MGVENGLWLLSAAFCSVTEGRVIWFPFAADSDHSEVLEL